jgi:hypothetical protein
VEVRSIEFLQVRLRNNGRRSQWALLRLLARVLSFHLTPCSPGYVCIITFEVC